MSMIRDLGTVMRTVNGISVSLAVTLEQDDATGQVFAHTRGTVATDVIDHRVSIGAADGADALAAMSAAEVKAAVQSAVDDARLHVAQLIANRVRLKTAAGQAT